MALSGDERLGRPSLKYWFPFLRLVPSSCSLQHNLSQPHRFHKAFLCIEQRKGIDDIEEIVRILRELIESRKINPSAEDPEIKVNFSTRGKECDDVQDLPKIAKSNRELSISVTKGDWPQTSLRLHPWFGTFWRSSGLTREDTWYAFHKLEAVFQKRKRHWSTLVRSLPWWLKRPPVYLFTRLRPCSHS